MILPQSDEKRKKKLEKIRKWAKENPEKVREVVWARASGTIDDIDGGTKSILTKKIPKNTERLFFLITFYYG